MMLKRLASIGLLAVVGSIAAGQAVSVASHQQSAIRPAQPELTIQERLALDEAPPAGIKRRQPLAKTPTIELEVPYYSTGRLIVKFRDGAQVRANGNELTSLNNYDVRPAEAVVDQFGARIQPAVGFSEERLAAIEAKARSYSNKAQMDIASVMYIDGVRDDERLLQIARKLNDLDIVEHVEFEVPMLPVSGTAIKNLTPERAKLYGSREDRLAYAGIQTDGPVVDALNQALQRDDCMVAMMNVPAEVWPGMELEIPIEGFPVRITVASITDEPAPVVIENLRMDGRDAWMTMDELDSLTAFTAIKADTRSTTHAAISGFGLHAIVEISPGMKYAVAPATVFVHGAKPGQHVMYRLNDQSVTAEAAMSTSDSPVDHQPIDNLTSAGGCGDPFSPPCVAAHGGRGCRDAQCCEYVQNLEGGEHCGNEWDEVCAVLAYLHCDSNGADAEGAGLGGPTPDFTTPYQAYLTPGETAGYAALTGFRGEGLNLQYVIDFADELLDIGVGEENLARGKTIRVAAIEGAYYPDHEDLDVTLEPDVELWIQDQVTEPNHGTAVLGIMNAVENGFGMTGIAPDAEAHFFPQTLATVGGRLLEAISSATDILDAGDVLNFSIGPGLPSYSRGFECPEGQGVLTSSAVTAAFVATAVDAGISCTISAGNNCCDLDNAPEAAGEDGEEGETGAVIVSACTPGCTPGDICYCRLSFSNFSRTPNGRPPHMSAWGTGVGTLGYGDLQGGPNDPDRSYTAQFNGTSSAAPMIAGAIACMQGLNKQFFGVPLNPLIVRDANGGDGDTIPFLQCGLPQPSPDLLGSCDDQTENPDGACAGDTLAQDADPCPGTPNYIAPFPNMQAWVYSQMTGSWFNDPDSALEEAYVIRGEYLNGNVAALGFVDGVFYRANSVYTDPNSNAMNAPSSWRDPLGQVVYRATGQIVDVLGVAYAPEGQISGLSVSALVSSGGPGILFIEVYDWDFKRWIMAGFSVSTGGLTPVVSNPNILAFPERFARDSDRAVIARAWIWRLSPPAQGPGSPEQIPFTGQFDQISINPTSDVIVPGD